MPRHTCIIGSLLGTAVGDALGLPYEGMSARRGKLIWGEPDRYRLTPGRGWVSDDTEYTCMVAQALVAAGDDIDLFQRRLAAALRRWLLLAPAGVGLATLRATARLCVGVPPSHSGVFSAGNGPAMRAAILGAAVDSTDELREFVRASTRITHTDPRAEQGALAVALAARMASQQEQVPGNEYLQALERLLTAEQADDLLALLEDAVASLQRGESTEVFARDRGLHHGVTGYVLDTVPVAVHAWLGNQADFAAGVRSVIRCGGDTDTTAAIVGGIIGAAVGKSGIPEELLVRLREWPRTIAWMENLATQLHDVRTTGATRRPLRLPLLAEFARNTVFAALVLGHGFRRLLPPW